MLELYCDDLADLLSEHKKGDKLVGGGHGGRRWGGLCARDDAPCRMQRVTKPQRCPLTPQHKAPKLEIKKDPKGVVTVRRPAATSARMLSWSHWF